MLPENNTYGPWPLSGECEPRMGSLIHYSGQGRALTHLQFQVRSISWKPAATARPIPHSTQNFPSLPFRAFLTEAVSLQRHRLRSRIVKLGSIDVAERRVEDVWVVDSAAINVRRQVPHVFPGMDRGFPVRFKHPNIVFSPRSLIPDNTITQKTHMQSGLRRQPSSAYAQPAFRRSVLPTW